jgi:FMN hydrolase / 5-amino-6-(5-phospho-D-ribitylamino)uracil phosphatase
VTVLRAVVFDVGETLFSEERAWAAWADWLGVRPWTLAAALGGVIERRGDHRTAFEVVRPGFDLAAEQAARAEAGVPDDPVGLYELYDDARPCLERLRAAGLRVGVAANQPAAAAPLVRDLLEPGELVGISDVWEISKPDPRFFARIVAELGLPAGEIAYVGDRVDNDVMPALTAGMVAVHVRRGPWGVVQAGWPEAIRARIRAEDLHEVADRLIAVAA